MQHLKLLKERNKGMKVGNFSSLQVLSYLEPRMNLSNSERNKRQNLYKGFDGEQAVYNRLIQQLPPSYHILTDLLLSHNTSEFQIDLLLIGENTIFPLEVKNYEGDFIIQNDNWYAVPSQNEIRNPLHQLKRMEILLRKLLKKGNFNFSIKPYILFIHPEFQLYQALPDFPFVFPTQINRFIRSFTSSPFQSNSHHNRLVTFFENQRLSRSAHERLPKYAYEKLKKGVVCQECSHFLEVLNKKYLVCHNCQSTEPLEIAIKRNIVEFITLFPNEKITTNVIHDWCNGIHSKRVIRRLLKLFLQPVGVNNHRYYVVKQ